MKDKDYDVEFDFKGMEVNQPWSTSEFKMLMQNEHVHLKLWGSENTVNSINIMCTLNGFTNNRAVNAEVATTKVPSKEEQQIARMSQELQKYFEVIDDTPVLNVYKRFDQIGVPITVSYVEGALKQYATEHDCKVIKVEAKGITIQSSVIENVTGMIKTMSDIGVKLIINSSDEEVMNKIGMYQSLSAKKVYSDKDKLSIIKSTLYPSKVGMLIKYKDSKATDEFGRRGKGKPISCRVAIYLGIKNTDGGYSVCFRTYNGNTFYTQVHWALEHDNNTLEKLDTETVVIPLEQFGMYNDFLGSRYHLITPVQTRPEDSIVMYGLNEEGKVTHTKMTIPERIKTVFDDWDIEYDRAGIQNYIEKTKELLG